VVIAIAIIAQSSAILERTRRAIDRDEVMQIPQSRAASLLSAALAYRRGDFLHLSRGALPSRRHAFPVRIPIREFCGYENRKVVRGSAARGLIILR
jgi:hypothetical protein